MLLEILEGQETYISAEKLQNKDYFMYPAYYSALLALINTVKQRQRWEARQGYRMDLKDCSITNIITFSAPRGGGKTSAMQSFAKAITDSESLLNDDVEECNVLKGADFLTLPLISPSVLRPGQGILPVVLSRMYQMAQDLWQKKQQKDYSCGESTYLYGQAPCTYNQSSPSEAEKSELILLFQRCLDGINAIKSQDVTTVDLTRLHELNDGASLRQHFYELVRLLLKLAGMPNGFLVLQLDDADSQVGQGYEMLEDIRKYLMLPNLVILMAADFDMLHKVVFKHHYLEFQNILERQLMDIAAVKEVTEKYLDKLIPPINLVHLPKLEQFSVQQGDNFHLRYVRDQQLIWESAAGISFQSDVLSRIYRKTGLAYVCHASYQNSIIPTTLRGLKQLLEILAHMHDIPEVTDEDKNDALLLANRVETQAGVAIENLARFSDYFLHDWINVKITDDGDLAFLRHLAQSSTMDRMRLIRLYLEQRCSEEFKCPPDDYSHAAITQCIEEASMHNRRRADYLFFFAVRTILSLHCHRGIWLQKAKAAVLCKTLKDQLLLFEINSNTTGIAGTYYIHSKYGLLNTSALTIDAKNIPVLLQDKSPTDTMLMNCLLCLRGNRISISYMQLLNLFLDLGDPDMRDCILQQSEPEAIKKQQRLLYNAQEAALFVASNWEVQRRLLVDWNLLFIDPPDTQRTESPKADNMFAGIRWVFDEIDNGLNDLNQGTIWTKEPDEGLYAAVRALFTDNIIKDLDFSAFYEGLYQTFLHEAEQETLELQQKQPEPDAQQRQLEFQQEQLQLQRKQLRIQKECLNFWQKQFQEQLQLQRDQLDLQKEQLEFQRDQLSPQKEQDEE